MAFIDRDPQEMLRFAKRAKDYAANMTYLIRVTQGSADFYRSDLDDKSQKCIDNLHEHCNKVLSQVKVYYDLADQIEKKAKKHKDIIDSARF